VGSRDITPEGRSKGISQNGSFSRGFGDRIGSSLVINEIYLIGKGSRGKSEESVRALQNSKMAHGFCAFSSEFRAKLGKFTRSSPES